MERTLSSKVSLCTENDGIHNISDGLGTLESFGTQLNIVAGYIIIWSEM